MSSTCRHFAAKTEAYRAAARTCPPEPPYHTFLQFWLPQSPSFSWTDCLQIFALSGEDLQQLVLECHLALGVLQKEQERRNTHTHLEQKRQQAAKSELYRTFKQWAEKPLQTADMSKLTPLTKPTSWLIARLTGRFFAGESWMERLSYSDKASVIRLALNLANYPSEDSKVSGLKLLTNADDICQPVDIRKTPLSELCSGHIDIPDAVRSVASLVFFAGNNVPEDFFSTYGVSWSADGTMEFKKPDLGDSVNYLWQHKYLIKGSDRATYSLSKPLAKTFQNVSDERHRMSQVLKHVCLIFPKDGQMEPLAYTRKGYALVPILSRLVPYLWHGHTFLDDPALLQAALDTFLSATQFCDLAWKIQAIRVAEELALLTKDCVNLARVTFRHWALKRLHPVRISLCDQAKLSGSDLHFPLPTVHLLEPTNQRSNAYLGQRTLMELQALIDRSASPTEVEKVTHEFHPLNCTNVSFQEDLILLECRFLYAKSLRYQGLFEDAADLFHEVLQRAQELRSRLTLKIVLQFADVESERGNHSVALGLLGQDKEYIGAQHQLELGSGRRLNLALANAFLMKALGDMSRTQELDNDALEEAERLFKWLEGTYANLGQVGLLVKQSAFQACCGLAMIYHIRGQHFLAYNAWEKARGAAERCWPEPGYSFMVIKYSQSQLHPRPDHSDAETLYETAKEIWGKIGYRRSFYFVGLGTMWLQFLVDRAPPGKRLPYIQA